MIELNCIENYITKEKDHFGLFIIQPLEIGQGITLGNALRRTLLSELTGFAITGVRINEIQHEFDSKDGLREDILEVLLNLKEIIFRSNFKVGLSKSDQKYKGFLNIKGPIIVTAGMFKLPKEKLQILNPNQYICTIFSSKHLYIEIDIEHGMGYKLANELKTNDFSENFFPNHGSTLKMDANFMPIKKTNYKVKLIHDTKGNIKESLQMEIITNGSISPKRSILESIKILMNILYPLFVTNNFKDLSNLFQKELLLNYLKEKKKIIKK